MQQIDLELYRWKWHNEVYLQYNRVKQAKKVLPRCDFWKEYGAFMSILPRQVGKTTMLGIMMRETLKGEKTKCLAVCPNNVYIQNFIQKTGVPSEFIVDINNWFFKKIPLAGTHLFVDDFDFISKPELNYLLDIDWASVNMTSTLS